MTPDDRYLRIVQSLNNAQLGSLGEFLAIHFYTKAKACVTVLHRLQRDIRINLNNQQRDVDVKAHRALSKSFLPGNLRPYYGQRLDAVHYEQVFFFLDAAALASD